VKASEKPAKQETSNMKIKILFLINFLIIIISSCHKSNEMKFDKKYWNERDDMFYANRNKMVNDLIKNHLKNEMKYSEIINLLGQPENFASKKEGEIIYEIETDYGRNIDPVEGQNLILKFSKDSLLINFYKEDWGRN